MDDIFITLVVFIDFLFIKSSTLFLKVLSNPLLSISLKVFFNLSANNLAFDSSVEYSILSFFSVGISFELFFDLVWLINDQNGLVLTGVFSSFLVC